MRIGIASGDRIPPSRSHDNNPHWGGSGWARLAQYVPFFEDAGHEVHIGTLVWNGNCFVIDVSDGDQVFVEVDVLYIQRLMHDGLAFHIQKAQEYGQIVINDLDDWYWGLSVKNQAFNSSHPKTNEKENINHYKSVLNASSLVTVSTSYLADRISTFVHCPIEVVPNYIDVARFTPVNHTDSDIPVIGWVGSTNHRSGDLETVSGIIAPMVRRKEITFMHGGNHPLAPTAASLLHLNDDEVMTIPSTDPEKYPVLLQMEIGIAPLNDVPFNHAKSDIKLLEYSAAGIPWIGSALSAYTALHKEWNYGRVAKKTKDWVKYLMEYKNPALRKEEGTILRELVKSRDISIGAACILGVIETI